MAKIISLMQDDLEKFVRKNRAEFDLKEPSIDLWNNIEQLLNAQEQQKQSPLRAVVSDQPISIRRKVLRYVSVAAVGLLLLTVGGVIGSQWSGSKYNQPVAEISLGDVSEEYAELENYYSQQVNMNIEKLKKHHVDNSILEDIAELDAAFQELKRELGNHQVMSDEEIIHAMIENYQMKVDILERVLERLPSNQQQDEVEEEDTPQREQLNM